MGNKALKSAKVELTDNFVHLADLQSKFQDVKFLLSRAFNVQLVPQFTTADTPGKSVRYQLQMEFSAKGQKTDESLDISVSSDDDDDEPLRVLIKFTETVTRELRKSSLGISRRTSVVKSTAWVGKSSDVLIDKKRLRFKSELKQRDNMDKENSILDFDLILCPSDLIIPESGNEWLLIGTLYVSNIVENKNYKWRAAVSKDVNA